jgi:uncharacterized membrane protein YfhO
LVAICPELHACTATVFLLDHFFSTVSSGLSIKAFAFISLYLLVQGESSFGANLLFALEGLVAPVCVLHQALLHLLPTFFTFTEMKDVCLVITQTESSTALCKCSFWMWIVGERLC